MPLSDLRPGQEILVTADWSSFKGKRGTIKEVYVMALLEGETKPLRIEPISFEVVVGPVDEPNLTGAE